MREVLINVGKALAFASTFLSLILGIVTVTFLVISLFDSRMTTLTVGKFAIAAVLTAMPIVSILLIKCLDEGFERAGTQPGVILSNLQNLS